MSDFSSDVFSREDGRVLSVAFIGFGLIGGSIATGFRRLGRPMRIYA